MARRDCLFRSSLALFRAAADAGADPLPSSVAVRRPAPRVALGFALATAVAFAAARTHAAETPAISDASLVDQASVFVHEALSLIGRLHPVAFFSAMAILCVLPVPVSAFYLGGAALYGTGPTLVGITVALAVNVWLAQTLAARGLRPVATRVLSARGLRVPTLQQGDELLFTVLVRIAPGVPFFAQNLVLGLAEVDRLRSIAVALPVQLAFASGFILIGRSAFEGRLGTLVVAVGLIASVSIAARLAHRRLAQRLPAGTAEP